jgi:putative pre-16S rRNA nuclease
MKILGLDIGDRWIGVAISDVLGMFARPYQTVETPKLFDFLTKVIEEESIQTIVAGYPKTLKGTESEQTKKVVETVDQLKKTFPNVAWQLWDERLTSKQANKIKKARTKEEKKESHSIAAALILGSYLDHLAFKKSL